MNYRETASALVYSAVICFSAGAGAELRAQPAEESEVNAAATGVEDDGFQMGNSCAALAYLSEGQLNDTIKSAFSDERHSFCFPEEPSECADYNGLLRGFGRLSTGEDGFHCNLQVQL